MKLNRVRRRRRDLLKAAAEAEANRDRLSDLPDDVLLNILERLDTLDALRTCILSKQMLHLPAMLTRIDIDIWPPPSSPTTRGRLFRANNAMADAANKILSTMPQPHTMIAVRQLKLRFLLKRHACLSIGKAVADAMASHKLAAAAVEFEIFTENPWMRTPADILGVAKAFNAFLGGCPDAFAGLTRLRLDNLRFLKESDFPGMLGTCKRLRSLGLFRCETPAGAGVPSVLRVEHDGLVELEIAFGEFGKVELGRLPKLQRMTYADWLRGENPLLLGFVPVLSRLSVSLISTPAWHTTFEPSQLLANAPSLSDLHLDFASEKIWLLLEYPKSLAPLLGKLRLVNMDNLPEECDFAWTMFFLEVAPSLEELCITVWDHWCGRVKRQGYSEKANVEWEPAADLKHKSLAKLTIHGFQPDDNFTGYVRRVMRAAANIEEVSLHDRKACEHCAEDGNKVRPSRYPGTDEEKDSSREKITQGLGSAKASRPVAIHFRS